MSVTCGRQVVSPGTPVSSTNKTDHQDITEILLKVALNIINQTGCRSNHTIKPHILLIPNYDLSLWPPWEMLSSITENRKVLYPRLSDNSAGLKFEDNKIY